MASIPGKSNQPIYKQMSFSEYMNKNVDEACKKLSYDYPTHEVQKIKNGSFVTDDLRLNRIRLWYDPVTNLIISIPRVG